MVQNILIWFGRILEQFRRASSTFLKILGHHIYIYVQQIVSFSILDHFGLGRGDSGILWLIHFHFVARFGWSGWIWEGPMNCSEPRIAPNVDYEAIMEHRIHSRIHHNATKNFQFENLEPKLLTNRKFGPDFQMILYAQQLNKSHSGTLRIIYKVSMEQQIFQLKFRGCIVPVKQGY